MPPESTSRTSRRREILRPLADYLKRVRLAAGSPSLREIQRRTSWLKASTLSEVLNAKTAPKLDFVLEYQRTCLDIADDASVRMDPLLSNPAIAQRLWTSQDLQLRLLRSDPGRHRRLYAMPAAPTSFIGRDVELAWLDQHLLPSEHRLRLVAVDGLPGVGKTACATMWVYTRPYAFADGVCFVDLGGASLSGAVDPSVALRRVLTSLGEELHNVFDLDDLINRFRTITSDRDVCIVLDNAWDETQVRPLIPSRGGCIITSRQRLSGLGVREGAALATLHPLTLAAGSQLIERIAGTPQEESREIAELCAGLPLGLRLAAELVSTDKVGTSDLREAKRDALAPILDTATRDPSSQLQFLFQEVYSTRGDTETLLLSQIADSPCASLSVHAIASLLDVSLVRARSSLHSLFEANLLQPSADQIAMHDLLRSWIRTEHGDPSPDTTRRRLRSYYLAATDQMDRTLLPARERPYTPPPHTPTAMPDLADYGNALEWGLTELDNIVAVIKDAVEDGDWVVAGELPHIMMSLLNVAKPWPQWISMFKTVADNAEHLDPSAGAHIYNGLGIAYRETEQLEKAIAALRKADEAYAASGNAAGRAMALNNLGLCQGYLGRMEESIETLLDAFRTLASEKDSFRIAIVAHNLAEGELKAGRPKQALNHAKTALGAANEAEDGVGIAVTLTTIGEIEIALENPRLAEHAFRQAAEMQEKLRDSHGLGFTYRRLARLLVDNGEAEEALLHAERALSLFEDIGDKAESAVARELVDSIRG